MGIYACGKSGRSFFLTPWLARSRSAFWSKSGLFRAARVYPHPYSGADPHNPPFYFKVEAALAVSVYRIFLSFSGLLIS
jgi:hypothetical protein